MSGAYIEPCHRFEAGTTDPGVCAASLCAVCEGWGEGRICVPAGSVAAPPALRPLRDRGFGGCPNLRCLPDRPASVRLDHRGHDLRLSMGSGDRRVQVSRRARSDARAGQLDGERARRMRDGDPGPAAAGAAEPRTPARTWLQPGLGTCAPLPRTGSVARPIRTCCAHQGHAPSTRCATRASRRERARRVRDRAASAQRTPGPKRDARRRRDDLGGHRLGGRARAAIGWRSAGRRLGRRPHAALRRRALNAATRPFACSTSSLSSRKSREHRQRDPARGQHRLHPHLVEPLGFSMDDRLLRRAASTTTITSEVRRHASWAALIASCAPPPNRLFALTTRGSRPFADIALSR